MKTVWSGVFLVVLALCGCGITVVPKGTATATVDMTDASISETRRELTLKARLHELEVAPSLVENNLTSFEITLSNHSRQAQTIPLDAFLLVDDSHRQYSPVPPEQVREILNQNAPYLIPYPYVGYYYLEDMEKAGAARSFSSSLPFFAANRPQDTVAGALPVESIAPGNSVTGLLFFLIDLPGKKSVELRGYLPDTSRQNPADFVLPFSVEN